MARPLRIVRVGAWYHITARGNERRAIYRDDRDRLHFFELIEESVPRFGLKIHSFVLMDNHYHLLVQLTRPNLSRAVQWINTSYSVWFNRRHRRCGHLLQGRFKAIIVDHTNWAVGLSRYIHLNPVRVARLGLSKQDRQRARATRTEDPAPDTIQHRLEVLGKFRWSSYPAYIGKRSLPWLCVDEVLALAGGKPADRKKNYRRYVEDAVREGLTHSPWDDLKEQVILGGDDFLKSLRKTILPSERKLQAGARLARAPIAFQTIVSAVEKMCGQKWSDFHNRHGDTHRDLTLFLARRYSGLTLAELARAAELPSVSVASIAVQRFARKTATVHARKKELQTLCEMLNVQL